MVDLPSSFTPTHDTDGLPGYPAIDLFGPPGTPVVARFYGVVDKLSGHDPADGGRPHGPYGWSFYATNHVNGRRRYVTHLGRRFVKLGDHVFPGLVVGTVCDSAVSGLPGTSHVHLAERR